MLTPRRKIPESVVGIMKTLHKFHSTPYLANENLWAIGYGHTRTVRPTSEITEDMADQFLRDDLAIHGRIVESKLIIPLNENQFGAMVMFCAHVSPVKFDGSQLMKLLNMGWYDQVPAQLRRWSATGSLANKTRRAAEITLWNTAVDDAQDGLTDAVNVESAISDALLKLADKIL